MQKEAAFCRQMESLGPIKEPAALRIKWASHLNLTLWWLFFYTSYMHRTLNLGAIKRTGRYEYLKI